MPVSGINRYFRLIKHIKNPGEYLLHKKSRKKRSLVFSTKPNQITFEVPESLYQVFKEIFMADVYEINDLAKNLTEKPIVVDIGANAGFFDFILLSKLPNAQIFAFEPMPANIERLKKTVSQNQWLEKCIFLYQMAVTGKQQSHLDIYMEDTNDNQVVASIFSGFNKSNTKAIRVESISLTEIFVKNNITSIDLLKMDCEGSEYDILYNTTPDLIQKIKRMVIEVHDIDDQKNNLVSFKKYLEQLGFSVTSQPINSFCHAVEAFLKP
ncbi:MAG: FkbM family methyltransferase [Chitinophagaceae bacterium]|nr:FkbM family methyltransferase [Chitinophagaceae bacterium]